MRSWLTAARVFFAGLVLAAAAFLASEPNQAEAKSRWGAGYFPNHIVQTHDGRSVRFYDDLIKGKIVAINFIYTSCPDICGLQTARLALVQDELRQRLGRDIFFYSISLDPVNDTPERLKAFAEAFSAGPGWTFVTGEPEQLHEIRHKLGERSRSLAEHRNDVVLGNDITGEWARSSVMVDTLILADTIRRMEPKFRDRVRPELASTVVPKMARIANARGEGLWVKTCAACHTVGMGAHVGPDLEGLLERRSRDWIERYVTNPEQLRAAGDAAALELRAAFPNVVMPDLSLNGPDVDDLLAYVERQSKRLRLADGDGAAAHAAPGHDHNAHHGQHEGQTHQGQGHEKLKLGAGTGVPPGYGGPDHSSHNPLGQDHSEHGGSHSNGLQQGG